MTLDYNLRSGILFYLYPVVPGVSHDQVSLVVDGHAPRVLELPLLGSLGAEGGEQASVHVVDLHPVIVGVAHDHPVRGAHGHVVRVLQLARTLPDAAELGHVRAVALEHLREKRNTLYTGCLLNQNLLQALICIRFLLIY